MATTPGTRIRPRKTIPVTRPGMPRAETVVPAPTAGSLAGVVSGTIPGLAPSGQEAPLALGRDRLDRLVSEAVRYHEKALRDFRRVEGIAQPVQGGLGFQALHLVFHKWIEMAAVSLERAAASLDDALFGLLRHLYRQTASGRDCRASAEEMRRTLEALDLLRQQITEQQNRLRQLVQ